MPKPLKVKSLGKYKIWIKYPDGAEGEVDLSRYAGKGVFTVWDQKENFDDVRIGEHGEIQWADDIDLCSDTIYLLLTGKQPEEVFPNLKQEEFHA